METRQAIAIALANTYEVKFIADDENRPRFRLEEKNLKEILVLLTLGFEVEDIAAHFGLTDEATAERLAFLADEELIKKEKGGYTSRVMVVILPEGEELREEAVPLAEEMVHKMETRLPTIKAEVEKIPSLAAHPFAEISFLVLSGMLLDFLQIGPLQEECLEKELPSRNDKRYTIAILEKDPSQAEESFGIPGNRVEIFDGLVFGLYGKNRGAKNFLNLDKNDLQELFSLDTVESLQEKKKDLLGKLLAHKEKGLPLEENIKEGFKALGIMDEKGLAIPVLARADQGPLMELASLVRKDFREILSRYEEDIQTLYRENIWQRHVTYGEFFLWYYHFFYTVVTEGLIARKTIKLPKGGNAQYIVR